jgi:hypothetical protein|tara:strand:+ start:2096 stop:2935 length:840 start_codon:yes stop_codon:yes gene_type:complete
MATTKVTTSVLGDDAVATARIADDAVTTAKIADTSVTSAKLAADAVETASIADDAVTLAKMAGGTDGNLITYDASGDPAAVATGSSGQNLSSNGAGAAPTFISGAWQLVSTTAITLTASLDTTGFESGFDYQVMLDSFFMSGDSQEIFFQVGTGSALSGTNDYYWRNDSGIGTTTTHSSSGDDKHQVIDNSLNVYMGDDVNTTPGQIAITIFNPNEGTYATRWWGNEMHMDNAGTQICQHSHFAGYYKPVTAITSCHFTSTSGTFAAQGTILVYRRKRA